MAEDANPAQPRSMTLMAGPIDTRVNPTKVNELANSKPIEWFEQNLIATVPMRYHGSFRRVYPGFVQLAAFMAMNIDRHVKAHRDFYDHLANGELEKAAVTKAFYDEYFAVLDLSEEFYIETVKRCSRRPRCRSASSPSATCRSSRGHSPHHAAHCRGRARRHLCRRPDARRPRPLQRPAALPQAPPFAARRRPLWRIQRQPVDQPDLSDHQERDPLRASECAELIWRPATQRAPAPPCMPPIRVLHTEPYGSVFQTRFDASFAALSDATRRGVLEQLGRADASITDLAEKFHMTLTGMKKHVGVLEQAGLVTTEKVGRVRTCKLGPRRLEEEAAWIERYRQLWDARFDELDKVVEELKRKEKIDGRKKRE